MLSFSDLLICLNVLAIVLRKEATVDIYFREYTIASKINGTSKGVYLPVSKLHSILAIANLLAHNNTITEVKFITAVKFHYKVVFRTI